MILYINRTLADHSRTVTNHLWIYTAKKWLHPTFEVAESVFPWMLLKISRLKFVF
jgi:hypothetical protein